MRNRLILAAIFVCFACSFIVADGPFETLLASLTKLTASYPQEKVHIHTDKPYYAIGEDIFLKAYVVTAERNEPSLLSAVLYVDLVNEKNGISKKITVALDKGLGAGSITLIDSLASGTYRLRAYTNYMRNYDADFFFEKFITIGSVLDGAAAAKAKEEKKSISLQFFPEGGSLVEGIRSRVGVKAVASSGVGANLSGYVRDRAGEKVALFSTEHAGMGVFALLPKKDEKYTAVVTLEDGSEKTFSLPDALASGFVLSVNTIGDNISAKVSCTPDLIKGQGMHVIAQANGVAYSSFRLKADKAAFAANIPRKSFSTGIVQFTLFTAENLPVAERLIFLNQNDALKINITRNTPAAGTKQKTSLGITATDAEGNPVEGNFSVSVTDMGKVPYDEDDETTILSSLLLTSDIKGYVEQPNYYFSSGAAEKTRQLDNLMLTQGWRRFSWKDVAAAKEPDIKYRPEQTLEISGKITNQYGKPLPKAKVILMSTTAGIPLFLDTISDIKGNFVFDRLDIPDSATFTVQAKGMKDNKEVRIFLNERPGVKFREYRGKTVDLAPYLVQAKAQFVEMDKYQPFKSGILIKEVKIVSQKPFTIESVKLVKHSANVAGTANYVVRKEVLEFSPDLASVFSKTPGLFDKKLDQVLIILDGVKLEPKLNNEIVGIMSPRDIEGIEVLLRTNAALYGSSTVIFITTKRGEDFFTVMPYQRIKNHGFSPVKEFYSPDYSEPAASKEMKDLRSTIYWKPFIITTPGGAGGFTYFNAETAATYRVTVEGMDALGNIGRTVFSYWVK